VIPPIRNGSGELLDSAYVPGRGEGGRVVVIVHGVTSHHDRPWLQVLAKALADAGIASLRFSFAGHGRSEGRYEDFTIDKEVTDLGSVLDAVAGRDVIVAGHSMGALIAVLRAAADTRIRALVSLAGMVDLNAFVRAHFGGLVPGRDVLFQKPECPLTQGFLDSAAAVGDVRAHAARIEVPWLVVHGTADELVPFEESVEVSALAPGPTRLVALLGADHRFTGREASAAGAVVAWLGT
jgi:pimeloyl-ACP methyl ester carboxylesterase